jgi:hypothetical protein
MKKRRMDAKSQPTQIKITGKIKKTPFKLLNLKKRQKNYTKLNTPIILLVNIHGKLQNMLHFNE